MDSASSTSFPSPSLSDFDLSRAPYSRHSTNPRDIEDRKNDPDDGIDYEELLEELHADILSGRIINGPFAFNSADYPTHGAAMVALEKHMDGLYERAMRELDQERAASEGIAISVATSDATCR